MGLCWSEPPAPPVVATPSKPCSSCGVWVKGNDYCEPCLQKNAMLYIAPSAPPMYPMYATQPQYTAPQYNAAPYQQQQMYQYQYYQARQQPQPQPQVSTGTAVLGGFVLGAIAHDMLDPTE